jgi:hypothetical protein
MRSAQIDLDLTGEHAAAIDALEAHVRRLSMPRVQVGTGMLADEEEWLETYRSLSRALVQIERLMFAGRGLEHPGPIGANTKRTQARTGPPSLWATRLSGPVL